MLDKDEEKKKKKKSSFILHAIVDRISVAKFGWRQAAYLKSHPQFPSPPQKREQNKNNPGKPASIRTATYLKHNQLAANPIDLSIRVRGRRNEGSILHRYRWRAILIRLKYSW